MDILYHAIVGAGISKAMTGSYSYGAVISSVLPDLIGTIPYFYLKVRKAEKRSLVGFFRSFLTSVHTNTFDRDLDRIMYRVTHSLFSAGLYAGVMYLCTPGIWLVPSLSYLSHILIDIPTHEGDFATRIFYPVSGFYIEARSWSQSYRSFVGFWTILILILYYF